MSGLEAKRSEGSESAGAKVFLRLIDTTEYFEPMSPDPIINGSNELPGLPPDADLNALGIAGTALSENFVEPVPSLGFPNPLPAGVREYDLATALPISVLQELGADGEGRFLLYGEETAQTVLTVLKEKIKDIKEHQALLIRLDQTRLLSTMAEELALNLFDRNLPGGGRFASEKRVVLVNPDEDTKIALHRAMADKNDACIVLETEERPWKLSYIGKFQRHLQVVLDDIRGNNGTTANEVAERLSMKAPDAGRRVKELYENGFVRREGRSPHTYTYFHPYFEYVPTANLAEIPYEIFKPGAAIRAAMLHEAAILAFRQNDFKSARAYSKESLKIQNDLGDLSDAAASLSNLGNIAIRERDFPTARACHQESLDIRKDFSDKNALADSLHSMGLIAAEQGDGETALKFYLESLEERRGTINQKGVASSLNNIANVYACTQRFEEAFRYGRESLALRLKLGETLPIGQSLMSFALLADMQEEWERMVTLYGAGLRLHKEIGIPLPPHVRENFKDRLAIARSALGEKAFDVAQENGINMTLKKAVQYALQSEEEPTESRTLV